MNQTRLATCRECGADLSVRTYKHRQRVGRMVVTDESAQVAQCPHGHKPDLTMTQLLAYERRAVRLLLQAGAGVDGAVMRFARKSLGLTQVDLGKLLDVKGETVSRWETSADAPPRAVQIAVASFVDRALHEGDPVLAPAQPAPEGTELHIPPLPKAC